MKITTKNLKKYDLNPQKWTHYGQWEQPPLSASFWVHWYNKNLISKMELKPISGRVTMLNGHTVVFNKDLENLKNQLLLACQEQDKNFFGKISQVSQEILENHLKLVPFFENSKADLNLFSKFLESAKKVMVPWMLTVFYSDFMGDILVKAVQKYGLDINKVINCTPKKETLMIEEYRQAIKIKSILVEKKLLGKNTSEDVLGKVKKDKILCEIISSHIKKYQWVGTHHFWGEPLTAEKFLKEIANLKEKKMQIKKSALPPEVKFLLKAAAEMGFLRQYSAEVFGLVAFKARPLLEEIAQKLGLNYKELLLLTPEEIKTCLKEKIEPSKIDILKREKGFGIFKKGGKEIVNDDFKEVDKLIKIFVPVSNLSVGQIKGVTACQGYAKGKVKVFLVPENLSKMKPGDILVTTMTTPDFVPLMKIAGAIVTDIGGLLSHAAIISRELGKPCIIGTKIATATLRDGDLVEVDATKGVVRKIGKH